MSDEENDNTSVSSSPPRLTLEERQMKYKPGSIRRVRLHNFLTYADVECFPGPRLNVVCGPNGTGKSTILCAICLGLGGQPPLLGRADDARTFIMHEKQIAIIEIELAPFPNKPVHIIKRTIDRSKGATGKRSRGIAASTYEINGKVVRVDAIKELVGETYRIAIDNLCTFLPQDRVGSFSGFDSKQLLRETEKSVSGTQHLYNDHERLIQLEADMLTSDSDLTNARSTLDTLESEVKKLEEMKKLVEEREEALQKMRMYEMKIKWARFEKHRQDAVSKKKERQDCKTNLKEAQKDLAPLEAEINKLNREYDGGKQTRVALEKDIHRWKKLYHKGLSKAQRHADEIDDVQCELQSIDANHRRAMATVKEKRQKLESLVASLEEYPSEQEIQEKVEMAQHELRDIKQSMRVKKDEFNKINRAIMEKKRDHETIFKRFQRMEDDKAMRNENILSRDNNLKQAFDFVNQNRKIFRRPVHGPIVCEVSTKDTDVANYLEQHVKNTVLKSFVVECREDMDLLYREVREKRKIRINIQIVDQGRLREVNRMYSAGKMRTLKQEHDVQGYLDEFFDAPGAILQALRNTSNVQGVLIGGQRTKDNLDNGGLQDYLFQKENGNGKQRFCIFAKDSQRNTMYKYTSTISRYGPSNTSVSTDEITRARMLSPGVPPAEKELVQKSLQKVEDELNQLQPDLDNAHNDYEKTQQEAQMKKRTFDDAKKGKSDLLTLKNKKEGAEKRLVQAERDAAKDDGQEKRRIVKIIRKHIESYISELEGASRANREHLKAISAQTGLKMSEDGLLERKRNAEERHRELLDQTRNLQLEVDRKDREFKTARQLVIQMKTIAERDAPIHDEDGNETPLKAKLDELSDDITELQSLRDDADEKMRNIISNPQVISRYHEQKAMLDSEREKLEILQGSKSRKRDELSRLRAPYNASLENIVHKVNVLFGKFMGELGCAGEIGISRGERRTGTNEEQMDNFKDWGIEIKVRFRAASDLQVLSAQVHSGGERSVSTIMYLMAMQDLMVSPFRCVDEINQGLDERNERLVFSRIVKNSTTKPVDKNDPSTHCGQYFLITPKLLPNLADMEHPEITVLCIFNGPYNFDHFGDWNVDKLLKMRRKRSNEDGGDSSPEKSRRIEEK